MFFSFPAAPRLADGVLLDTVARVAPLGFNWSNETTADDATKGGEAVQVSFVFADPPQLSYWCVRCPNADGDPFRTAPTIVFSVGHLALLRVDLAVPAHHPSEYFLYRAGSQGRRPDLELLPLPDAVASHISPDCVAISPRGDGSFVVAAVVPWSWWRYELHVFVPERRAWTRHPLAVHAPGGVNVPPLPYRPRKAIALGSGRLGWADLFHGVLLCDALVEPDGSPARARFVPFPKLLPGNQSLYTTDTTAKATAAARRLRDIAYDADRGLLWLVELEQLWTPRRRVDVSGRDVVHDSESSATDPVMDAQDPGQEHAGWRLVTWYRGISWDCWCKGGVLYSQELFGRGITAERDLQTSYPTLPASGGGDQVVYLRAMTAKPKGNGAWNDYLVGVDMRHKAVVGSTLVSDKGSPASAPTYVLSALPRPRYV